MRGNNLSYEMFKGVNLGGGGGGGGISFLMRLVSGSLLVSVLTFLRWLLSRRLSFLSRLVCDHDRLGCRSVIVHQC